MDVLKPFYKYVNFLTLNTTIVVKGNIMKKLAMMSLALMATYGSAFAASADFPINLTTWETPSQNLKVINVCNLTDNDLNEITLGHHPETAVEFSAQTTLPISFFLKGDLVNLVDDESLRAVEIIQTFYVRCVGQELVLSTNLTDWKPFLEFITGTVSVTLSMQEGKPSIVLGAEANQRS